MKQPRCKTRLRGATKLKLKVPGKNRSYVVQSLDMADGRYAIVKRLRERLSKLMEEVNADTVAKKILANRAMFLLAYIESVEVDSLNQKHLDWKTYLSVLKQLTDVLNKLGLDRAAESAKDLSSYLAERKKKKQKANRE